MTALVAAVATELSPQTEEWARLALARSGVAGADGTGLKVDKQCALGHGLFRTAPGEPTAPICVDGIWVAGDVRLDDQQSLLAGLGRRAGDRSTSNLELVAYAYQAWGEQFLAHLAGDFAFALWDSGRGRLWCGRDQFGVVPLHYAQVGEELLMACSIDALLLHPGVSDDLDEGAVADFLVRGWPGDLTSSIYRAVRRVPPGHRLTWADGRSRCSRYWQLPEWEPLVRFPRPGDYGAAFRDLLDQAVSDRLTDGRAAVQLSGGMDSTSVAASALAVLRRRGVPSGALRAVTDVMGGGSGDVEGDHAALVAAVLGIDVDWIDSSTQPVVDPWPPPLVPTPEPLPYQWTEHQAQLGLVPARHARVAFTGIGGDPLLWSSPWYWAEWLAHGQLRRLAGALADEVRLTGERPHPRLRQAARRRKAVRAGQRRPSPAWLDRDFATRAGAAARQCWDSSGRANDARSLATDPMWSTWFMWGHPTFSGVPIKFRHPLVDRRLVSFVLRLAPVPWLADKRVLRDAAEGRLPEATRLRPKTPLVRAPSPGSTPEARCRMADLVRGVPGLDRFVDRDQLASSVLTEWSPSRHLAETELIRPLGLAYWLAHRQDNQGQVMGSTPSAQASG